MVLDFTTGYFTSVCVTVQLGDIYIYTCVCVCE